MCGSIMKAKKIIFDTDIGWDCDDAGEQNRTEKQQIRGNGNERF